MKSRATFPDHIVTHLIQHDENSAKFLALSFWTSREAFRNAYSSAAMGEFNHWLWTARRSHGTSIGLMCILPGEEALAAV